MQINHEDILKEITTKVTRDDGEKFIETARLDCIKSMLADSEYEIFRETDLAVIYKKKNVE